MFKASPTINQSKRKQYEQKYNTSRMNLLLVVIFTMINIVLLITNADRYFLFSAFIPYYVAGLGMILCGRMPDGFYSDPSYNGVEFLDDSFFIAMLVIAVILTLFYLLAWSMSSKNRVGWLIFALVFFIIDTLGMFAIRGFELESIIDIVFHAWVIYYLVLGISANKKLKALSPKAEYVSGYDVEAEVFKNSGESGETQAAAVTSSIPLRDADMTVKHRVLLETRVLDYNVCYRRVKHTNELVINGKVYDEMEAVIERAHTLTAVIDGHCIEAMYNGAFSLILLNGEIVAKKIRWY